MYETFRYLRKEVSIFTIKMYYKQYSETPTLFTENGRTKLLINLYAVFMNTIISSIDINEKIEQVITIRTLLKQHKYIYSPFINIYQFSKFLLIHYL